MSLVFPLPFARSGFPQTDTRTILPFSITDLTIHSQHNPAKPTPLNAWIGYEGIDLSDSKKRYLKEFASFLGQIEIEIRPKS
jgi:hypothetical protein